MAMKHNELLKAVKDEALDLLKPIFDENEAIQTNDYKFVIESDKFAGRYFEVAITAKDVITDDEGNRVPYNPFIEVDRWEFDKKDKAERAEERARKHAETIKRDLERKAKRKAQADAKKAKAAE